MDTVGEHSQTLLKALRLGVEGIAGEYPGNVTPGTENFSKKETSILK